MRWVLFTCRSCHSTDTSAHPCARMASMTLLDRFRVDGKVAIVTGASRGLGAASAVALAEVGADVVIAARSKDTLAEVTAQIESHGRRAIAVAVDLDDLGAMQSLID